MEQTPVDWRGRIAAAEFAKAGEGEWVSPEVKPPFAFDELIYSWNVRLPEGEGFRVYLKAGFAAGDDSPWLYGGHWGAVKDLETSRAKPRFDRGEVDMDWLKLKEKAVMFRFKVEGASTAPLTVLPSLAVVATDNRPSPELAAHAAETAKAAKKHPARLLDLPFRRQMDSSGTITPNRCQSAALATALEYYGKAIPLEDIVRPTFDPEYNYPGVWPRVIGAAGLFGFDGYIDRFRDWDSVRAALAENKVILCSIRMKEGDCKEPPYDSMGHHIVALNGVTDDGRVVVTDSFLAKSGRGYRCQWLIQDFEKIWMKTKNGVSLVICPPAGAQPREIKDLPPFPAGREPITGDDH